MRFKNREDAALRLIPRLAKYKDEEGLVLAVPRGGVPIAYYVAKHYNLPLDLLMTKKIGHPLHEEFAIGAVSLEDHVVDEEQTGFSEYIASEVNRIRTFLKEQYKKFMGNHRAAELNGKTLIIIDDGMATGNTILSSIKMLRRKNPKRIVVAVPVVSQQAVEKIGAEVDDIICLYTPEPFISVGLHYLDFSEVNDREVIRLLKDVNHFNDAA